jgi:phage baseplate assembly protein W
MQTSYIFCQEWKVNLMRYKKYTIKQGDTLQLIAQNHMSSMSQWTELAQYNKLKHPYIVEDPSIKIHNDNVVAPGDNIIIPVEVTADALRSVPLTIDAKKTIEELTLGRDFSFIGDLSYAKERGTQDEILQMTLQPDGRLAYVKGTENLRQALLHRLWTKRGTLTLHPEYGSDLHTFIGQKLNFALLAQIKLEAESTLRIDPRVEDIRNVAIKHIVEDNSVTLSMEILPTSLENMLDFIVNIDNTGTITLVN